MYFKDVLFLRSLRDVMLCQYGMPCYVTTQRMLNSPTRLPCQALVPNRDQCRDPSSSQSEKYCEKKNMPSQIKMCQVE